MNIPDLACARQLTSLQSLDCSSTKVSDLAPLKGLTALQSLNCHNTRVSHLAPLEGLLVLESLDCSSSPLAFNMQVSDLAPLMGLLALQSFDFSGTRVSNLAPLKGLAALQTLHCSRTKVSDLAPLEGLTALQSLDCSYTEVSDLASLKGLAALQSLDCSATQVSDLAPLEGLTALQSIHCSDTQVSNLAPLKGLTALQSLDCRRTQVSDLAPLQGLPALQSIHCSATQVGDLAPLKGLPTLRSLDCSWTQVSDIAPLKDSTALQSLDCSGTQVGDLAPIKGLPALESVNCSDTQVGDLAPLKGLPALRSLDCSWTQVSDIAPLKDLTALQSLDCSGTQVSEIAPLVGLAKLKELTCNEVKLAALPEWFVSALTIRELIFHKTRIPGVPAEILSAEFYESCLENLRAHFLDEQGGVEPVVEIKLMVLGNGRVGKTQFCRRLAKLPFQPDSESTHGVAIVAARLRATDGEDEIALQMWDFGGQDIYHGTHALFMRDNAVFALLWAKDFERRSGDEGDGLIFGNQPLGYWVDYVKHLGGRDRAVTIVQTRCDRPEDDAISPVPETVIKEAFGRYALVHFSAATNRGRANLIEKVTESVAYLRERQGVATIGVARHRVKTKLEAMRAADANLPSPQRQHRTLTQTEFRRLCTEAELKSEPEFLLDYLHRAGVVFYRKDIFEDRIILDQTWALDAIYAVFNRTESYHQLRRLGGRFTRSLLETLVWRDHSRAEQELFLDMMRSCGVCFVRREGDAKAGVEAEYIAPELLPRRSEIERGIAAQWDADTPIETQEYPYEFLHQGLIRRIIAEIGSQCGVDALYWRDGLCAYEETTRARAMIEQRMEEGRWRGRIVVQTRGGQARELLSRLCRFIDEQQNQVGLVAIRSVPKLPAAEQAKSEKTPLAFGTERSPDPRFYVSYAWADSIDPERETIVDQACAEAEKRGTPIIRDESTLSFGDSISKFMRAIGEGDRIFVFLSDKYLKSPFCMFELFEIWRNSRQDNAEFLRRVRVYTLGDAQIWKPVDRVEYGKYWKDQHEELRKAVGEAGLDVLGEEDLRTYKLMQDFASKVGDILALFANIVQPRSFEDLKAYGFNP
jgi:internalin A